jgi:hypothetical protein
MGLSRIRRFQYAALLGAHSPQEHGGIGVKPNAYLTRSDNPLFELDPVPQRLKPLAPTAVQPGTCFTFQTGHMLYTLGPVFGVFPPFVRRSRRGGGNVGIPGFGISIFPSPNHLTLDLHPTVAPPAVCACRGEQWVQSRNKYDSNDHRSAGDRRVRRTGHG